MHSLKSFLLCWIGLFCCFPTQAETLLKINYLGVSERTRQAVDVWAKEAVNAQGPSLHVLLKEGSSGDFSEQEKNDWLARKAKSGVSLPNGLSWKPNKHGAQIVWQNEQNIGCVVHVPNTDQIHSFGTLPKEWVVWHELSHCLWPMNKMKEEWWQIMTQFSGVGVELGELQEESWADAWALWFSKKEGKVSDGQVIAWMRSRTEEALTCRCMGHWTNTTISFGLAAFQEGASDPWKDVSVWLSQTTLQAEDLDWLKWAWSQPHKKTSLPTNLWLKDNAMLLMGTGK